MKQSPQLQLFGILNPLKLWKLTAANSFLAITVRLALVAASSQALADPPTGPQVNTFSIVACNLDRREWGIGVASRVLAVGKIVPWGQVEVGALAVQARANADDGPKGLSLLRQGTSADETIKLLIADDQWRELRQFGVVDTKGMVATYTGSRCADWAGGKTGKNYACQGNLLAGPEVVDAMAQAFEQTTGTLAWRIMAALEAGDDKGGDKRGKQSAAIVVVKKYHLYGKDFDRWVDLRVDDHAHPVPELARILALSLPKPKTEPEPTKTEE